MSNLKIIDSSIKMIGSRLKIIKESDKTLPLEDQFYTISNEPIVTINGEKIVPIKP